MKISLFVLSFLITTTLQARIYIPIDQPSDKKMVIAITPLVSENRRDPVARELPAIIQNDLVLSGYFEFIPEEAFLEPLDSRAITTETIPFDLWISIETQLLIKGSVTQVEKQISVQLKLFDPFLKQMLVGKQYIGTTKEVRAIAHRFADEVMMALTGISGPFNSRIAYSAFSKRGSKAIFVMDVDGENNFRITDNKTVNLAPNWSPDGTQLAFTSFQSGAPEIYVADLSAGKITQLTQNRQTNTSPRWTKDGAAIFFTSSVTGDPELWAMTLLGKTIRQVTEARGIDIAPAFSPDGSEMIYASERAGRLHLFREPVAGGTAQRLTFVGIHNDTPDWSPDGNKVVFCSQDMGYFDLFVMNADGSFIQRLTAHAGNNEHPRWSPDGRFIVFSSTRSGGPAIYITRFDGANTTRISPGNGQLPDWGPRLK